MVEEREGTERGVTQGEQAWPVMVTHLPQATKNVCGRPEVPQVLAHVPSKKNVTLFNTVLAFCREVNVCPTNLSSAISRPEVHSTLSTNQ